MSQVHDMSEHITYQCNIMVLNWYFSDFKIHDLLYYMEDVFIHALVVHAMNVKIMLYIAATHNVNKSFF